MKQPTILVLEDDRDLRKFLVEALTGEGYSVHAAASLAEVDTALRSGIQPDLLICDALLRGEVPLAAFHAIDNDTRLSGLPVIVSTGATHLREAMSAWAAGPRRTLLIKPFALDELFDVVDRLLPVRTVCDTPE